MQPVLLDIRALVTPAEIDAVLAMRAKADITNTEAERILSGASEMGYGSVHCLMVVIDTSFDNAELAEVAAVLNVLAARESAK